MFFSTIGCRVDTHDIPFFQIFKSWILVCSCPLFSSCMWNLHTKQNVKPHIYGFFFYLLTIFLVNFLQKQASSRDVYFFILRCNRLPHTPLKAFVGCSVIPILMITLCKGRIRSNFCFCYKKVFSFEVLFGTCRY